MFNNFSILFIKPFYTLIKKIEITIKNQPSFSFVNNKKKHKYVVNYNETKGLWKEFESGKAFHEGIGDTKRKVVNCS